jgi:hypothetical protein
MHNLLARIRARLVADWKDSWRWWSVRLHAAVALLALLVATVPGVPAELQAVIPAAWRAPLVAAYSLLGIALRLVQQRKAPG